MNGLEMAKDILSACLFIEPENVTDEANLNDLGINDSLTFELLIGEIEEKTGKPVDPVKLLEINSVSDLVQFLEKAIHV